MCRLFTIGYSGYGIADFINALRENKIRLLVDVRSMPYSSYYRSYDKDNLEKTLRKENIDYRHFKREFGGRQTDPQYCTKEGHLDFELFAQSPVFNEGVRKIIAALDGGYRIALMCAEKDPLHCHRAILIARVFHERGVDVSHLYPGKENERHSDLEKRLLSEYKLDDKQISFFDTDHTADEKLKLAYKLKNADMVSKIADKTEAKKKE